MWLTACCTGSASAQHTLGKHAQYIGAPSKAPVPNQKLLRYPYYSKTDRRGVVRVISRPDKLLPTSHHILRQKCSWYLFAFARIHWYERFLTHQVNILGIELPWTKRSKRFRDDLSQRLGSMREHTLWIDVEANFGLHLVTQKVIQTGHKEILSKISAMDTRQALMQAPQKSTSYRLLPHVANSSFFGRHSEMKKLEEALLHKTTLTILSIMGEGGVGKSQLALNFAYSSLSEFHAIFWVSAETKLKAMQGYEEIAAEIGLFGSDGSQGTWESVSQWTRKWLRDYGNCSRHFSTVSSAYLTCTEHSFLLIFDNVVSMDSINDQLPTGARGSVLITTRNQNLFQPPITAFITLRCFDQAEGQSFILQSVSTNALSDPEQNSKDAAEIWKACGGLPLALSHLLRFTRALNIPLAEANARFTSPGVLVNPKSELNEIGRPDYYHQSGVPRLWDEPLLLLNPACSTTLQFLAHLDPDDIPEEFLKAYIERGDRPALNARHDSKYGLTLLDYGSAVVVTHDTKK